MRGTLVERQFDAGGRGIIPAYAGNTLHLYANNASGLDHPRVCGEHILPAWEMARLLGSSPRMRGTLPAQVDGLGHLGIIPAYAGNTASCSSSTHCSRDHPRVCGEHQRAFETTCGQEGSSPRMRGTLIRIKIQIIHLGIIPAYAGNTPSCTR